MHFSRTIGPVAATLININIIIGGGIFINLNQLLRAGETAGFTAYLVAALFMLPVVMVLARLAQAHPESGGLYVYAKTYLHPYVGFLCGWGYFASKAISVGLMSHLFMQIMQGFFPVLRGVSDVLLVGGLLAGMIVLNVWGVALQGRAQYLFIAAKMLPILFVFGVFCAHGSMHAISFAALNVTTMSWMVPIAIYAMVGFEVTCTVAHLFKDPDRTITRALVGGFLIVVGLLASLQFMVGALIAPIKSTQMGLPIAHVAQAYLPQLSWLPSFFYACIYTSMLGGAFSILTSNAWNLHRLAEQGHLPFRALLTKVTRTQVPWVALVIQSCISVLGIAITHHLASLQKMAIFGMIFAFCCATLAAFFVKNKQGEPAIWLPLRVAAFASSCGVASLTLYYIVQYGISFPYLFLLISGAVLAAYYELTGKRLRVVVRD